MNEDKNRISDFDSETLERLRAEIDAEFRDDTETAEDVFQATRAELIFAAGRSKARQLKARRAMEADFGRAMDGLEFLTTRVEHVPLWGDGKQLLWVRGQATMIAGPQGVGKSTVAQLLVLARLGLRPANLFGHSVAIDDAKPILYLAMDRPDQIGSSMARMVDLTNEDVAATLKRQLVVWRSHPPFKADQDPDRFAEWVANTGRDPGAVIFDSVKDMLTNVVSDEAGLAFNTTVQKILASGTDVLGNHHLRKANGDNKRPDQLSDVYGSTWLTSGLGSVVLLWGEAGARNVELRHLKPIAATVGPLAVSYDHATGEANGSDPVSALLTLAHASQSGFGLAEAVEAVFGTQRADPDFAKHSQSVRRRLKALVTSGKLIETAPQIGGGGGGAKGSWWEIAK